MKIPHGDKPNVIVFFTDQQRWDTTGIEGNPLDLTPNYDRFARHGTHLSKAFTCQPVCGPARSCLQTGMYATENGCFRNGIPLREEQQTVAHYFREAGYQTAYIGKWHLAAEEPVPPNRRGGYEYWLASNALEHTSDAYDTVVYDSEGVPVRLPGYRVDALTDASIRYIDSHHGAPFFLFFSLLEPHHQNHRDDYPAPEGYQERYTSRWVPPDLAALGGSAPQHLGGYFGMVKRIDEAFGRLLDCLKSLELSDNTIVVFTSDHGNHFKTRNAEYKRSCHESSIHVPMAIDGPHFRGGGHVDHLVSLIDLPPTLLNAVGIPVPETMQGSSFLDLVQRGQSSWQNDVFVQISESQVGRCIRTDRWKYSVSAPGVDGRIHPSAPEYVEEFLYDLYSDPNELSNLAGLESHQEVAEVLRLRLIERIYSVEGTRPRIEPAPRRPSGQRKVFADEIPSFGRNKGVAPENGWRRY